MRTPIIVLFGFVVAVFLTGCKNPDNVQTHSYVDDHMGGTVQWHPHVKEHYSDFEDWATGKSDATSDSFDTAE